MKDICIIYPKERKNIIKKLTSKLESDNISCWISPRDFNADDENQLKEKIEQSGSLLLITDKTTNKDKTANLAVEYALENNLEIIPYVVDKIEEGLYADYFFYAFSWIDAFEDSFEEAYEVLLESFKTSGTTNKPSHKKVKNTENNVQPKYIGIAAVIVILLIAAWFIYNNNSTDSTYDDLLVGEWHLSDYKDNLSRTPQDSVVFLTQTLPNMKKTIVLIFNNDHTFERRGFTPEPQIGKWELKQDGTLLELEPVGVEQKQKLSLQNFTEHSFTIVVNEQLDNGSVANTRLTFTK